jgi:hypothetical protein
VTALVGVAPPGEVERLRRLLAALEHAFPVRFVPRSVGEWDGLAGAVLVERGGGRPSASNDVPCPYLVFRGGDGGSRRPSSQLIRFASTDRIDPLLSGRELVETHTLLSGAVRSDPGTAVVAEAGGEPIWTVRSGSDTVHEVAFSPRELEERLTLRDELRAGRFLSLLPLVEWLRAISGFAAWTRPPIRASILFDDPNLHRPSYGFVNFGRMARSAKAHGYHVGFATVPLDCWLASRRAVAVFREHSTLLSLVVHGNDHVYREFERLREDEVFPVLAQAERRVRRFERRTGLGVGRVVVAPHGRYAPPLLAALARTGFEALCGDFPPPWWYERAEPETLLGPWTMADVSTHGVPIVLRYDLAASRAEDEFLFWAYLDKPVVLYGHHGDVAGGLGRLEQEAETIRRLGAVEWMSLQEICRTNYLVRREHETAIVRLFSRRTAGAMPRGCRLVRVELPESHHDWEHEQVVSSHGRVGFRREPDGRIVSAPFEASARLDIGLVRRDAVAVEAIARRRTRPQAAVRRAVAEARDRIRPLAHGAGLDAALRSLETAYDRRMTRRSSSER